MESRETLPTAHWRKKGDLISGFENGGPGSELLIAGGDHGGTEGSQLRLLRGAAFKEFGDGFAGAEFDGSLGAAGDFLQFTEKEDASLHVVVSSQFYRDSARNGASDA